MAGRKSRSRAEWERALAESLSRAPERRERFETGSRIPVQRLYTAEELGGWNAEQELGYPGLYPDPRKFGIQGQRYINCVDLKRVA